MSIYVDDSLLACSSPEVAEREMRKICKFEGNPDGKFEGTVLEPQQVVQKIGENLVKVDRYDVLGADLFYSARHRWCRWSMES
jgi:hypothetical protein